MFSLRNIFLSLSFVCRTHLTQISSRVEELFVRFVHVDMYKFCCCVFASNVFVCHKSACCLLCKISKHAYYHKVIVHQKMSKMIQKNWFTMNSSQNRIQKGNTRFFKMLKSSENIPRFIVNYTYLVISSPLLNRNIRFSRNTTTRRPMLLNHNFKRI